VRSLGAILINPPVGNGARTLSNLGVAARPLKCSELRVGNLFHIATANSSAIGFVGWEWDIWLPARENIVSVLAESDEILFAWGVSKLRAPVSEHFDRQVRWVSREAARCSHRSAWIVGDGPRHPSRWHQFVSDRRQRTNGRSFEERLLAVLDSIPIGSSDGRQL
jgi:hypothetical protein